MSHIFLSFAHIDNDFAMLLYTKLEQGGFDVWVDSEKLRAGKDWRQEIDNAIRNAFVLIVVMTPESKASEYVTYEWAYALGREVSVIPILHKLTPLHPRLEVLQYLDFTHRTVRPWDTLMLRLKEIQQESSLELIDNDSHLASHPSLDPAISHLLSELDKQQTSSGYIAVLRKLRMYKHRIVAEKILETLRKRTVIYDHTIRLIAVETLGQISDPVAVPVLIRIVREDKDENVKIAAVEALGNIKDELAVPSLIDALKAYGRSPKSSLIVGNERKIASAIAQALRQIGTEDALAAAKEVDY